MSSQVSEHKAVMHENNNEGPAKAKESKNLKEATQPQEDRLIQSEKTETEKSEVDLVFDEKLKIDADASSII